MLAVKLHRHPHPGLNKGSSLVPIVDWQSGRVQIRRWLRWNKRDRYLTLVQIPDDQPVRLCFTYGPSDFIKQVVWPDGFRPMRKWPAKYVRAIAQWWDAWRRPYTDIVEFGGLMADEPQLFLGRKLPHACVKWTKDVRLLYQRQPSRQSTRVRRDSITIY